MKLILLVEDNNERGEKLQALIPPQARCIWAKSAGAAIGVLRRDALVGILLDHDLEGEFFGFRLDGQSVAKMVCETQSNKTCRVFIHSQNTIGAHLMLGILRQAGFEVDRCPWSDDAVPVIREWLEESLEEN